MAPMLLQKLFNKKAATATGGAIECPAHAETRWASSEFDLAQIRLIVYQDCERRGRQVLFDSKAVRKLDPSELNVDETKAPPTRSATCQIGSKAKQKGASPSYQPTYHYTRPSSDVNMLGEMMFGSVAMSYKGSTLKIHHIRSPPQLMVSKVFSARCGSSNTGSTNTLQDSLESISQTCPSRSSSLIAHSNPMDMPGRGHSEDSDSGIARSASLSSLLATPLPSPGSSYSSGCASSYQRRWFRSQTTSLQHGLIPRWSTDEMFSLSDESCSSNPGLGRRKKIAVSIIISLPEKEEENQSFQEFFFSHFPLFESHMNKLKTAIERAMIVCRRVAEPSQRVQVYLCRVMEALGEFRMTVWNLYMAPRITEPVWLTLVSQSAERNQLCQRFLKEMNLLMEHGAKNQFLSSLVTAVLMYHLAWVPTVMPSHHPPIKALYQKHSSHTVDQLAKCHPYNPLWAQLGDLYGALGSPVRVCRTVVIGRRRELVQRVLYILSYFIRCCDLQENTLPQAQTDSPANPCPNQNTNPAPCSEGTDERPLTCDPEVATYLNPNGTNEKILTADTNSTDAASGSEGTSTEAGDSELAGSYPLPETTNEQLNCAQERSGETGLGHTWANPSPPVHRVHFMIGSPKESEIDRPCWNRMGPRCGRGLHRKIHSRLLTDSLDSSDEEELSHRQPCTGSEMQQKELPLPSCEVEICPDVNHFGRSLLGGYSPQYMPDFVLHGVSSDQRLKQCLMGDLEHTVLHPALDEPIAEAMCIVADTDRLCVQVATTQRRVCEPGQIGRDVMVSNLVHTLLTSVLQLHALNMAADFCVMHLEDRLQEVYFKSCSLAEYLRGQRRVHVKELGLALGIESSDLPLLTAVASTHSPYVAQILL